MSGFCDDVMDHSTGRSSSDFLQVFVRSRTTPLNYNDDDQSKKDETSNTFTVSLMKWIRHHGGILILSTANVCIHHLYMFPNYSFLVAFGNYMVFAMLLLLFDCFTSSNCGDAIKRARLAGYSDATITSFVLSNLVSSQMIGYLICMFVINDRSVFSWNLFGERLMTSPFVFVGAVVFNLFVTEAAFTLSHGWLHTIPVLQKFHVLHHCWLEPSYTTNLFFHPVDLILEFSGPAACLLATHYLLWSQDDLILLTTYIAFQLWYMYDHDDTLNLYHVDHHRRCNSMYTIYGKIMSDPRQNQLRELMRRKGFMKDRNSSDDKTQ